jgi:MoxR-like ATPase
MLAMFAAAFDLPLADVEARVGRRVGVHVSGAGVQIGVATVAPFASQRTFNAAVADDVRLLPELNRALEALALCIERRWLAVLVGESACGKTSLVRALATLCGARLVEFSANSAVDTSELLGGFEQVDATRHRRRALAAVAGLVEQARTRWLHDGAAADARATASLAELHRRWHAVDRQSSSTPLPAERYDALDQLVEQLAAHDDVGDARAKLALARELDGAGADAASGKAVGRFEWIDGVLIEALETGAWLLIDNVNFCPPSVLDRLNPLLEPNGVLLVNERGLVGGAIKAVRPHPNFRIIMCMDAHNGEISRAMRNRGVEICVLAPTAGATTAALSKHAPMPTSAAVRALAPPTCAERVTLGRLLAAAGVRDVRAVDVAWRVHSAAQQLVGLRVRWRDLRHLGEMIVVLAQCGIEPSADAWVRAARMAYGGRAASAVARERLAQCLVALREFVASVACGVDVRWPLPTVGELRREHALATAQTHAAAAVTLLREWRGDAPASAAALVQALSGASDPLAVPAALAPLDAEAAQRAIDDVSGAALLHLGGAAQRGVQAALFDTLERSVLEAMRVDATPPRANETALAAPPSLGAAFARTAADALVADVVAHCDADVGARIDPALLLELGEARDAVFGELAALDETREQRAAREQWRVCGDLAVRALTYRRREQRHVFAARLLQPESASVAQGAALVRVGAAPATAVGGALRGAPVAQLQPLLDAVDAVVQQWLRGGAFAAAAALIRARERLFDAAAETYDDETLFVAAWRQLEHVIAHHEPLVAVDVRVRCKAFASAMRHFGAYDVVVWRRVGRPTLMPTEALHQLHERLEALAGELLEFQVLHTRHTNLVRQRASRVALLERQRHVQPRPVSVLALIGHESLDSGGATDEADPSRFSDDDADNRLALKLGHNRFLVDCDVSLATVQGARSTLLDAVVGVRWATAQRATTTQRSAAQLAAFLEALGGGCDRVQALLDTWRAGLVAAAERRVAARDAKSEHAETKVLLVPARYVAHRSSLPETLFEYDEFASALIERDLTCALARVVGALCAEGRIDDERGCVAARVRAACGADIEQRLAAFVELVLNRTARSVLDCAPYRALGWWLAHTGEQPLPLRALQALLCEMQAAHAQHVAHDLMMTVPLDGAPSLHHGTVARQVVHVLSNLLASTPLADRRLRVEQLERLAQFVAAGSFIAGGGDGDGGGAAAATELTACDAGVVETLACFDAALADAWTAGDVDGALQRAAALDNEPLLTVCRAVLPALAAALARRAPRSTPAARRARCCRSAAAGCCSAVCGCTRCRS